MKKILIFSLSLLLAVCAIIPLFSVTVCATDTGLPEPPEIEGVEAYYFYNITRDKLMASYNENTQINTSTSAKVMSGMLICEALGNRLGENIQVTEKMISGVDGIRFGYAVGETVLIKDLLYTAICGSYNDAMQIAACVVAGEISEFVTMMNKRASDIGATKTHYTNPLGYPDNQAMLTTASDVAKIALEAQKNELYMEISSSPTYKTIDGDEFYNKNYLICSLRNNTYQDDCFSGMNAGSSTTGGNWSVVTVASDENQRYLCVILGGRESDSGTIYAYKAANKLANWALTSYDIVTVYPQGYEMGLIPIGLTGKSDNHVPYVTETELKIYIPIHDSSYDTSKLTYKIELIDDEIDAPANAGQKVGVVKVYYRNECVGKCNLVLTEDYEQNPILWAINKVSLYLKSRAFLITLIAFVIVLPITFITIKIKSHRTKRRSYRK